MDLTCIEYFNIINFKKNKMKKIISTIIIVVFLGTLYVSCDSKTYEDIETPPVVITNPTYTANIGPIFQDKCVSCHSNGLQSPNLTTYDEVKASVELAPGDGGVLCYIDNPAACFSEKIMPPVSNGGRMPQATIDLIKLWKEQGFAQ